MGTWWNTGEIKAARKGTGHPPRKADGSGQVSSLTGTPQHTDCIWDLPLPFTLWIYDNLLWLQCFLQFKFIFIVFLIQYFVFFWSLMSILFTQMRSISSRCADTNREVSTRRLVEWILYENSLVERLKLLFFAWSLFPNDPLNQMWKMTLLNGYRLKLP